MLPFKPKIIVVFISLSLTLLGCSSLSTGKKDRPPQEEPAAVGQSRQQGDKPAAPNTPESKAQQQFDAGLKALQAGRDQEAERIFVELTKTFPTMPGPYTNIGFIYQRTNRLDAAQQAFSKAVELNPANKVAYNNLGIVYRNLGRFDDARNAYEKALQADPAYAPAHLNLAILYDIYLNDLAKALEHYERYKQLVPAEEKQVAAWIADLKQRGVPSEKQPTGAQP